MEKKKKPEIRFEGFTDDWEQRKLKDVYGSIGNAFVGTATPYYVEHGHFYLESNNIKDGKIILRLFNAEGDRKQHNITFDMPLSSIEEVDLNGRIIDRKTIKTRTGKSEISISMPRFGLKTFALNLN